jgi:hypothetical protein
VTPSQAAEAFRTTTHEISEHIAGAYKSGVDIADVMHQRKMVKIPEPANLTAEQKKSDTKVEIWKKMCSQHGERFYWRVEVAVYELLFHRCEEDGRFVRQSNPQLTQLGGGSCSNPGNRETQPGGGDRGHLG